MNLIQKFSISLIFLNAQSVFAVDMAMLKKTTERAINFLAASQVKETQGIKRFIGEWACYEDVDKTTPRIGDAGYSAYDSNLFTTATIHNSLAEIYKMDSSYSKIPGMLKLAMKNIILYKNEDKELPQFNFWQKLPIPENLLGKGETIDDYPYLRRGNHFHLMGKFVWYASNVQDDADDTSLAFTAYKLNQEVLGLTENNNPSWLNQPIAPVFDKWRDRNRTNFNIYNLTLGDFKETGAYLTWLGPEGIFPGHLMLPRVPEYIPFGTNDIDCVVNTNVIGALALYSEENAKGYKNACDFVNSKIRKNQHKRCGVYYPNEFNFYYTAMRAHASGAICIEESLPKIIEVTLENQNKDGSWDTANKDHIQSTAYALGALMKLPRKSAAVNKSIDKGVEYLLSVKIDEAKNPYSYWDGGVFFSGGRVFRQRVSFRSTPYTTALIAEIFVKYLNQQDQN